jgi:hypothetical protein
MSSFAIVYQLATMWHVWLLAGSGRSAACTKASDQAARACG